MSQHEHHPDWDKLRRTAYADDPPPTDWPKDVHGLSFNGLSLFGVHRRTLAIHWDGKELQVKRTIHLGLVEKTAAIAASMSAVALAVVEIGRTAGWWL